MFGAVKRLLHEYGQDRIGQLSAAFSYFTLFSIGPLLLVVVSIAGYVLGTKAVDGQLAQQLTSFFGADTAQTLQSVISHTRRSGHSGLGLLIGIVSLLLGAGGLFNQLQSSFDQIFKVAPDPQAKLHNIIWPKVKGILLLFVVSVLVIVSVVASAVVAALGQQVQLRLGISSVAIEVGNFGFSAVIIGLMLGLLYAFVPDVHIPWRLTVVAGLFVGVLFSIGKTILGLVIGRNGTASAYGAAAALITLLLWVFYFGQIVFLGAEGMKVYGKSHGVLFEPKKHMVKKKTLEAVIGRPYAKFVEAFQRGFDKRRGK